MEIIFIMRIFNIIKKAFFFLGLSAIMCSLSLKAQSKDPLGTIVYSLPQTVLRLEVEAEIEQFHAGPYSRFAMKYLGIEAGTEDKTSAKVSNVRLISFTEADQSQRFVITPAQGSRSFLELTSQGLISKGCATELDTRWVFPAVRKGDFSNKGVASNLTSESATLYKNVKKESSYNIVAVSQQMVVEKSLDTRAKEAADMIVSIRKKKFQILTGDTDASYSGEALGAAIKELSRMENDYLQMFIGYSDYQTQKMNYDILPSPGNEKHKYIAFRVSDNEGLVPADNVSGKPYILELTPEPVTEPQNTVKNAKGNIAYYRIPAVCTVKLIGGAKVLLQSRVPVYQLGITGNFLISNK